MKELTVIFNLKLTKFKYMWKTTINGKEIIGTYEYLLSLIPTGMLGYKIERIKS
ncbi:MAG: hypothetical protein M0R17_04400 [Candidatus Omnitrophica bacterium]|jgi:hypothetical protein|nr:hypothetical protein [Candidatus Omnitrophota bacterium]